MAVRRPEEMHRAFADAFNASDADAIMALYEPEAALVSQPGKVVAGSAAIREALGGFLALKGTIKIETASVVTADDIALTHGRWTITGPAGSGIELSGRNAEVSRRQADGTWRMVIDNPFADQ